MSTVAAALEAPPRTSTQATNEHTNEPTSELTSEQPAYAERDEIGEALVARVASLPVDHPDRPQALEAAFAHWAPMAIRLSRPFLRRTSEREDLKQVALTALVQAILRYDAGRGDFPPYAVPTITGEIRRWLRDARDLVRVPRRLREIDAEVLTLSERLEKEMGRRPTTRELAERTGVSERGIRDAEDARAARWPGSLDDESISSHRAVIYIDKALEVVDQRRTVVPLIAGLDKRSRDVLVMRYFQEMTQSDIASEVGVSQVQVSRILSRTIDQLRGLAAA
ncbi:MAG: sigma-70 family RNA polymerase sigma factor [Gemmatimonadota bacterium]|nr:sigma-70 family RNA polymerase sigma factor [Gemmatimonadota bacterium]